MGTPMTRRLLLAAVASLLACAAQRPAPPAGAPAAERIAFVEGGAGRLRVSDGGAGGTPVVFVHGLGGDLEVWRSQLDHLRATGRRAVAYDQRGHGQSDRARDGVYGYDALADDLEAVRAALGLGRIVLVGHSMSGGVLTTYAGRHPDLVAGLVYLDAVGDFHAYPATAVQPYRDRMVAAGATAAGRRAAFDPDLRPPARPATREKVLAALDRVDPVAFARLAAAMFDLRDARERFAPYRGPAAAVEVPAEPTPDSASAVLGLARTVVPGVSHWLQLDDPAAVNREIDAFLARAR